MEGMASDISESGLSGPLVANKKHCFVLYNSTFSELGSLEGHVKDYERIHTTFSNLGFDVKSKHNVQSSSLMEEALGHWLQDIQGLRLAECVVVFILTHGQKNGVLYACDGSEVRLSQLRTTCRATIKCNKVPLLFFVEACRGDNEIIVRSTPAEDYQKKSAVSFHPKIQNSLVYYPTAEGYAAFVRPADGSVLVSKLCDVLDEYGKTHGLLELITKVNHDVSSYVFPRTKREMRGEEVVREEVSELLQCPEAEITLTDDVFFGNQPVHGANCLVEKLELRYRNPCYVLKNVCEDHQKKIGAQFGEYKKTASEAFRNLNFEVMDNFDGFTVKDLKKLFKIDLDQKVKDAECVVFVILACGGSWPTGDQGDGTCL